MKDLTLAVRLFAWDSEVKLNEGKAIPVTNHEGP
jgi:hypothetical protein